MASMLQKIRQDRRGNVLAIAAAALPLVIGSAGLATDTIQWSTWKRQLQRAADSAAFAGVYSRAQNSNTTGVSSAVSIDLQRNNHTPTSLLAGYPQIGYPTSTAWAHGVQVTLAIKEELSFSSMFLSDAPTITASATAALVSYGEFCLVALHKGTDPGIIIGGSSSSNLGCGAISNGIGANNSAITNGNAYSFTATMLAGAGGLPSSVTGTSVLKPYHMPQPDPFAGKYPTDIPAGLTCKKESQHVYTQTTGSGKNKVTTNHLPAGCYSEFKFTGSDTYYLDPGVYYLNNTNFDPGGSVKLVGTGVTIVLTGTTPGTFVPNGNATLQLTAPTTGTYAKMLFIQSDNATVDNDNQINGNSSSKFDGAFYFPKGKVTFTGSSADVFKCMMVVAKKAEFTGNTALQNNKTGCSNATTVPAYKIKLVA
jgi:Flp pilus assembly protein TadG